MSQHEWPVRQRSHGYIQRLLVVAALCLLIFLLIGGVLLLTVGRTPSLAKPQSAMPHGIAWFYDVNGQSDGIALRIQGLAASPTGKVYVGWLINPYRPDQVLSLTPLARDSAENVNFRSDRWPTFNADAMNLRSVFTQVMVTMEDASSVYRRPGGAMVMQGALGKGALTALEPIFVGDVRLPGDAALLPGLQAQMRELEHWTVHMLEVEQKQDVNAVRLDLLRLRYVLAGAHDLSSAQQKQVAGAGDGVGLLSATTNCASARGGCGYLDAVLLALQPLAPQGALVPAVRQEVVTTLGTLIAEARQMQQRALSLVALTKLDGQTRIALAGLVTRIDALLNGVDRDGNGTIDAVPGEAGAAQLYTYMQLVGSIQLTASA